LSANPALYSNSSATHPAIPPTAIDGLPFSAVISRASSPLRARTSAANRSISPRRSFGAIRFHPGNAARAAATAASISAAPPSGTSYVSFPFAAYRCSCTSPVAPVSISPLISDPGTGNASRSTPLTDIQALPSLT
jgi:hypothetical protein